MMSRFILCLGYGLILAVVAKVFIGSLVDLLRFKSIDIWSILLIAGCILTSIGLGLTKSKVQSTKYTKEE